MLREELDRLIGSYGIEKIICELHSLSAHAAADESKPSRYRRYWEEWKRILARDYNEIVHWIQRNPVT